MTALRSILFNILFYGIWTPLVCIGALPVLLLPGHKATVRISEFYQYGAYLLEKFILGLDYEIRGAEFRPQDGTACLIAAKHFSAYETLKLFLLFDDPAIILKR